MKVRETEIPQNPKCEFVIPEMISTEKTDIRIQLPLAYLEGSCYAIY